MAKDHVCPAERHAKRYKAFIVDPSYCLVLVKKEGSRVSFPSVDCPEIPFRGTDMSDCFSQVIARLTQIHYDFVFLYSTINEVNERYLTGTPRAMFECISPIDPESEDPVNPTSNEFEWMLMSDLEDAILKKTVQLVTISDKYGFGDLFRGDNKISEDGVRPWEKPRWFEETTARAASELSNLGYSPTTRFEQHKITTVGAVLRVDTNNGRVFLKASTGREVRVTQCVGKFAPFLARSPLHVNVEGGWMLMDDYGPSLDEKLSRGDYENILPLYGKLQLESVRHLPELLRAGTVQLGAESTVKRVQKMLEDPEVGGKLGDIVEGGNDLKKLCDSTTKMLKHVYEESRIPLTLVHGDLHDGNIIKTEDGTGRYVVFDWESAVIDIPFLDMVYFMTDVTPREDQRDLNLDAYLELWTEYGTLSELRELCDWVRLKRNLVRL